MASLYASIASGHFLSSAILSASSTRPAARLGDFCALPRFWACELSGIELKRKAKTIRRRIDFETGDAIFIVNSERGLLVSLSLSRIAASVNTCVAGPGLCENVAQSAKMNWL